ATAEITVNHLTDALLVPNAALRYQPPAREPGAQGGLLSALIPFRRFGGGRPGEPLNPKQARVYVLENGHPKAVRIAAGPSGGTWTMVKSGDVAPETELVTDSVAVQK